jgi:hypothetical protein
MEDKMADLEYKNNGMFTHFYPNTPAGEDAWRVMAKEDGVAAVFSHQAKDVIRQLKAAGYTVRKAKPLTKTEIENIYKEMEELGL